MPLAAVNNQIPGAFRVGLCCCPPSVSVPVRSRPSVANTVDCMLSGVVLGTACMVDGLIERYRENWAKFPLWWPAAAFPRYRAVASTNIILDQDLLLDAFGHLPPQRPRPNSSEACFAPLPLWVGGFAFLGTVCAGQGIGAQPRQRFAPPKRTSSACPPPAGGLRPFRFPSYPTIRSAKAHPSLAAASAIMLY